MSTFDDALEALLREQYRASRPPAPPPPIGVAPSPTPPSDRSSFDEAVSALLAEQAGASSGPLEAPPAFVSAEELLGGVAPSAPAPDLTPFTAGAKRGWKPGKPEIPPTPFGEGALRDIKDIIVSLPHIVEAGAGLGSAS